MLLTDLTGAPYTYAAGNPLSFTDPTGLFSISDTLYNILTSPPGKVISNILIGFGDSASLGLTAQARDTRSPGPSCTFDHGWLYWGSAATGVVATTIVTGGGADTAGSGGGLSAWWNNKVATADDTGAISLGGRYSDDQNALIQLAKQTKRTGGVSMDDANALADWADELGLPGHGPAVHPGRSGFGGTTVHINVGPIKHISVIP